MTNKDSSKSGPDEPEEQASQLLAPGSQASLKYTTGDLFKGLNEILIEHRGAKYRLRITKSGGLILNK